MRFFDRFKAKNEQSGQAEITAPTANSIAKGFPVSPLIKACEANDFDAAMRLLKEGADPNEKSPMDARRYSSAAKSHLFACFCTLAQMRMRQTMMETLR